MEQLAHNRRDTEILHFIRYCCKLYGKISRWFGLFLDCFGISPDIEFLWDMFIALAIVLHNMYHNLNEMPQSGFHLNIDTPVHLTTVMEIMTLLTLKPSLVSKSPNLWGVATGSIVRAKHIGKDILAGLKNIVGGELKAYTELLMEARTEALGRMMMDAAQRGGNAVVNVRFATSSVAGGAAELFAYGTAIVEQE